MNKGKPKITFSCSVGSHTGLVRALNEDNCLALPEYGLWVVADGMGGHEAGEIASQIAIREIADGIRGGMSLVGAIEAAHHAIQSAARGGSGAENMGTTVVAAKLRELDYEIAWVGDSRAYLWNGTLRQLTLDHSYVQSLLNAGLISADEVASHPHRNVISRALGLSGSEHDSLKIDCITGKLDENDTLLLCSDGLHGEVSDEKIAFFLAEVQDNKTRVDRLIDAALSAGGRDNVTVILVTPEGSDA